LQPPAASQWDELKSSLVGAFDWMTFGMWKTLGDVRKTMEHLGGLVGLVMDLNGEDKENILSVTLCEYRTAAASCMYE
jgi:hypothetical protein